MEGQSTTWKSGLIWCSICLTWLQPQLRELVAVALLPSCGWFCLQSYTLPQNSAGQDGPGTSCRAPYLPPWAQRAGVSPGASLHHTCSHVTRTPPEQLPQTQKGNDPTWAENSIPPANAGVPGNSSLGIWPHLAAQPILLLSAWQGGPPPSSYFTGR